MIEVLIVEFDLDYVGVGRIMVYFEICVYLK